MFCSLGLWKHAVSLIAHLKNYLKCSDFLTKNMWVNVDNLLTCSSWKKGSGNNAKNTQSNFLPMADCEFSPLWAHSAGADWYLQHVLDSQSAKNDSTRQSKSHTTISATIGTWRGTVWDNPRLHHDMSNCSNYTEGNYLVSAMDYGHLKKDTHLANHR